jgi:uncharacterized iron-regulated protein
MNRRSLAFLLTIAAAGPAVVGADDRALDLAIGDPARKDAHAAVVLDGITDARTADVITPAELAARLDGVRLLFVGESHTNDDFHQAQLRVIQELHKRGRQVLIGLEMYPASEQEWLERWFVEKEMTEDAFVAQSRWYKNWGYHWNYYSGIFAFAHANGIRMFGVNAPRTLVQTVRMKGFEALTAEQRAYLPERIDLDSEEHKQLFRAFFSSADALHGSMPDEMFQTMFRAQCTWDAAMGWNALQALKKHGGEKAIMVVLIGSGHVAYGLGAERQTKLWFDGRIASLVPIPVADAERETVVTKVRASYADFVWGLPPETDPLYPTLGVSTPEQKSGERFKVIAVAKDSVGAAAGFAVGDELVSLDGVPIVDKETTNRLMSLKRWGDAAEYKVMRGGQEVTLTAHFRRNPPQAAGIAKPAEAAAPAEAAKPAMPAMPGMPAMPPAAAKPPKTERPE